MLRVLEREAIVFRKLWRGSAFSSFVTPVMFLAAIGLGLGGMVERRTGQAAGARYLAFAAPLAAYAATQDTDLTFPVIMRLGIVPLFLFSGTFFPIGQLPPWLRPVSVASPLWHAIELCRQATTATPHWTAATAHTAVLIACVAAGWRWGTPPFARGLTPGPRTWPTLPPP